MRGLSTENWEGRFAESVIALSEAVSAISGLLPRLPEPLHPTVPSPQQDTYRVSDPASSLDEVREEQQTHPLEEISRTRGD